MRIQAASVVNDVSNLLPIGNIETGTIVPVLPQTESQVRPLTSLDPDAQREVWQTAVSSRVGGTAVFQTLPMLRSIYKTNNQAKSSISRTAPNLKKSSVGIGGGYTNIITNIYIIQSISAGGCSSYSCPARCAVITTLPLVVDLDNLVLACVRCNSWKGNKTLDEFRVEFSQTDLAYEGQFWCEYHGLKCLSDK